MNLSLPTIVYYCILLYSATTIKILRACLYKYNCVCVHAHACWICMCVHACACVHVYVLACMCVVVITPKMEWNQSGAHYILTTFPLSLASLFATLTALLMAIPW